MMLYLDTNIWIAYHNSTLKKGIKYKTAQVVVDFFSFLEKTSLPVLFSYFNLIELTEVLRDTLINFRLLVEGYSIFDLSRVRKNHIKDNKLSPDEDDHLEEIRKKLTSFKFLTIISEPEPINQDMIENLFTLTGQYFIQMPDALHIIFALKNNCKIFVTNDKSLITQFREAQKNHKDFKPLKICKPEEFLENKRILKRI